MQKNNEMKPTYDELLKRVESLEQEAKISHALKNNLTQTNQLLGLLIDTMPNPVFYKDSLGVYQKCNSAFSELILGIPKEQIIGKTLFELPDVIPPELAQIYKSKDDELFNNPGTQFYEGEVLCADNQKRRFFFYKATLSNEENEIIGLVGIMLDVTELRVSQEELKEKNKQLEKLSYIDSLTDIYNRRKFDDIFSTMIDIAQRNAFILNFVIIDVDDFKLYNDTYGHLKGDKVLKKISSLFKQFLVRRDDYIFRLGGEEFGLLFYSNTYKDAYNIVEKIKKGLFDMNIEHKNRYNRVTLSAGLVSVQQFDSDIKELYNEADRLLYNAKASGRNAICSKSLATSQ